MCSAIGQVCIFITIAKFGALTSSLMSLTRKVTTLTASILIYHHELTLVQVTGLLVALVAMLGNFVRSGAPHDGSSSANAEDRSSGYATLPSSAAEDQQNSSEEGTPAPAAFV